jgi:hypothetical protein
LTLTSFEALGAFAKQLEAHIASGKFHTKVVTTPSSVDEKGVIIKVSILKSALQTAAPVAKCGRNIRVRVSVCGAAESMTGLEQALDAIEAVDGYLATGSLHLEVAGVPVPNSRIVQHISEEDSFIDSPDSTSVQDVQDDRTVTITIPQGD